MAALQYILIALILISGSYSFITIRKTKTIQNKLSYPLTTFLIVVLAILQDSGNLSLYKSLVIGGLIFALAANTFSVIKESPNLQRMLYMMITIILFTLAFSLNPGPYFGWIYFIPTAIYVILLGVFYFKRTKKPTIPTVIYFVLLNLLLSQSSGRVWYLAEEGVGMAFLGVVLFVSAETVYIYNRYIKFSKTESIVYLSFYWMALLLISFSI